MFLELQLSHCLLLSLLLIAVWIDQREQRIPNLLVLTVLAGGMAAQLLSGGLAGLLAGLAGMLLGFAVYLLPYLRGGMGAGDVKLMAAVGMWLGPGSALLAATTSLMLGAGVAMAIVTMHFYRRSGSSMERVLVRKFPYAIAIAGGVAATLVIRGVLWNQ